MICQWLILEVVQYPKRNIELLPLCHSGVDSWSDNSRVLVYFQPEATKLVHLSYNLFCNEFIPEGNLNGIFRNNIHNNECLFLEGLSCFFIDPFIRLTNLENMTKEIYGFLIFDMF